MTALAGWVSGRRGRGGDLTTFMLEQSLDPQIREGIGRPCPGGLFYLDRWRESLAGITGDLIAGEIDSDPRLLMSDVDGLLVQKNDLWFAIPAPHLFGLRDGYFGDGEEAAMAVIRQVKRLMRAMRDRRAGGHVVICRRGDPDELGMLAMKRCFFFLPDPGRDDLATLLEYQRTVAVSPGTLPLVCSLMGEYEVRDLILIDPDTGALQQALMHFDREHIAVGGYCTAGCQDYWKEVAGSAIYSTDSATDTNRSK